MILIRVIKILVVLILVANVFLWLPATRLSCLYALGRTSRCPFQKAVRSFDTNTRRGKAERQLNQQKRLLATEASFHQWETPMGTYWVPARNDATLVLNLAEQATKVYGEGRDGVQPGDVVLDCGANVGVFTHEALADGARLVVAVEPAPENVECLRRNFANEIIQGRVIVVPKGVWDKDDTLTLRIDADNSARDGFVGSFGPALQELKVPLITIDELVADAKIGRADFIKLDVEGAEKAALAGAKNTLAKFHPRLAIAMEHLEDDPVRIPQVVLAQWPGYRPTCGDCIDELTKVRVDVMYFQ